MRLRLSFSISLEAKIKRTISEQCPIAMDVHETRARLLPAPEPMTKFEPMTLTLECPIADPEGMTTQTVLFTSAPVLVCPELDLLDLRSQEIAGALSLLYRTVAVSAGLLLGTPDADSRLLPESAQDETIIKRLRNPAVFPPLYGAREEPTIGPFDLTGDLVGRLAERPGILVFWEVGFSYAPVARYRELWRVLEQSFRAQGRSLRAAILTFPPAIELGFNAAELADLEVLRGRASHAADRLGHREAATVHRMVMARLGRLQALVERVLLTKSGNGDDDDDAVDELLPFRDDQDPADFNRLVFPEKPAA